MTVVDWRSLSAADVARCYEVERAAWTQRFDWDTTDNWRRVEAARAAGTLPGFAVMDGPTPVGWGFHLLHRGTLQIGGVTASSTIAVEALLDGMLTSPEARRARDAMAFIPDAAAPVRDVMPTRGFDVRTFAYLMRALDTEEPEPPGCRSFHAGRLTAFADLLARSYPGADPVRPFAPNGTGDEWLDYTGQLAALTGCGELLPWASVVDEQAGRPGHLIGGVLTTRIAPRTAHVAQVAVDPASRGQGRGGRLLRAALTRLRTRGYSQVSLLVADDNAPALRLYTQLGFRRRGAFLSAWRPLPAPTAAGV